MPPSRPPITDRPPDLPHEWVARIGGDLGAEGQRLIEVQDRPPLRALRCNPQKPFTTQPDWKKVPWSPATWLLPTEYKPAYEPAFHGGAFYVQEPSSTFLDHVLSHLDDAVEPKRILDLSAAPGGKSTLLQAFFPKALLVANEVVRSRTGTLIENLVRWGATHAVVTQNDPRDFAGLDGYFDLILVDAPCSGEGLFRKDHASRDSWTMDLAHHCSLRQQRILADVLPALKPGGRLIYSTCTYNPAENEAQVSWLAETFDLAGVEIPVDVDWGIETTPVESRSGQLPVFRFWPHRLAGEGFFLAVLQKDGQRHRNKQSASHRSRGKRVTDEWLPYLTEPDVYVQPSDLPPGIAFPAEFESDLALLRGHLKVTHAGIRLGQRKGDHWVPAHDLAMSQALNAGFRCVDLGRDEALDYLSHQALQRTLELEPGWLLARHEGCTLGWVKVTRQGQWKNHHPIHWRLRQRPPVNKNHS